MTRQKYMKADIRKIFPIDETVMEKIRQNAIEQGDKVIFRKKVLRITYSITVAAAIILLVIFLPFLNKSSTDHEEVGMEDYLTEKVLWFEWEDYYVQYASEEKTDEDFFIEDPYYEEIINLQIQYSYENYDETN